MKRIKLSVLFVFLILAISLKFYPLPTVIGQSAIALAAPTGLTATDGTYSIQSRFNLESGARRINLPRFAKHNEQLGDCD